MSNNISKKDSCKHSEFCSNPYPCTDYCLAYEVKDSQIATPPSQPNTEIPEDIRELILKDIDCF